MLESMMSTSDTHDEVPPRKKKRIMYHTRVWTGVRDQNNYSLTYILYGVLRAGFSHVFPVVSRSRQVGIPIKKYRRSSTVEGDIVSCKITRNRLPEHLLLHIYLQNAYASMHSYSLRLSIDWRANSSIHAHYAEYACAHTFVSRDNSQQH